jgi:DNA-binding transcriptional regulator YdaS (Cro superfamily)
MYKLAAKVGIWPGTLGQMVNERIPLPVGMAKKIEEAIEAYIAEDTK